MITSLLLLAAADTITFRTEARDMQVARDMAETRVTMMVVSGRCKTATALQTILTQAQGYYVWTYTVVCTK